MPHFVLDIINLETEDEVLNQYKAVWKPSRHLSFEEMERKLEDSKGKPVLIMMEVHRVESINISQLGGYELILQDFTTKVLESPPPPAPAPEVSQSPSMLESQPKSESQ